MINSRKVEDLDQRVRDICEAHVVACRKVDIELLITSTWRDSEAQEALYAIGRTTEIARKPVTNARGGQSWHNYRCAWDVVPLIGGKAVWDANNAVWADIVRLGESVGAEAGAKWKFPDLPHFQVTPTGLTLSAAMTRFRQRGTIFI